MSQTSLEIVTLDAQSSAQTSQAHPQASMSKSRTLRPGMDWLHCMVCWFFCCQGTAPADNKCFYMHLCDEVKTVKVWVAKFPIVAIRRRFAILCLAWVILNLTVPRLRSELLLGSELWKWSILVALVSCGYHLCSQGTKILVFLLRKRKAFTKRMYTQFYVEGARRSVSLVLYTGWVLLTWLFYFRRSWGIKETSDTEVILHIGTWTFVTLAVASLLWLFKTVLVLLWEADAVYNRFKHRILKARLDIYVLAQICVPHLNIWDKNFGHDDHEQEEEMHKQTIAPDQVAHCADEAEQDPNHLNNNKQAEDLDQQKKNEIEKKEVKAKEILFGEKPNMHDIKRMAMFFVNFSNAARQDDGSFDVLNKCRNFKPTTNPAYILTGEDFKKIKHLRGDEHEKLLKRLHAEHGPEISYENFEKSMVKAHKNCLEIGRTLFDAGEVVKVLDRVWTGLVVVIATIAWLLLTDIASTKMLVLIASPFLAATFIFGDTCKKIFEGIIFSFVNHPFDVGDRCIVDKTELEVKRMSVFSTTFMAIGTKEEVLYPNSALASIPITNLKGEPDPNDHVELPLDWSYTGTMLDDLRKKIIRFFSTEKDKYEKEPSIVIKEIGDSCIRMAIDFKHVMRTDETARAMSPEEEEAKVGVVVAYQAHYR